MDTVKKSTTNVANQVKGGGIKSIILMVVVLLLAYMLYQAVFGTKEKYLSKDVADAKTSQTIKTEDLPVNSATSNYTYSMWFYVNDWNYKYGDEKVILQRTLNNANSPKVYLDKIQNNIAIDIDCTSPAGQTQRSTCTLANVPLQKWVNLIISLNTRALDVYMDGKLVRTCLLPSPAIQNNTAPIYITPQGGFDGFTSAVKFIPNTINPQQAYDIYVEGYGGGGLSSILGKYKLRVAILENGQSVRQLTI